MEVLAVLLFFELLVVSLGFLVVFQVEPLRLMLALVLVRVAVEPP